MNFFYLISFILITGCYNITQQASTCKNSGNIDFIYINTPCDECIDMISKIINSNPNIFNSEIIRNKENHILINYCYNYHNTSSFLIEKTITDKGFLINQSLDDIKKQELESLCCELD